MKCKKCGEYMRDGNSFAGIKTFNCLRCNTSCQVDLMADGRRKDENVIWDFKNTQWD